jgi:hypothetical protein
MLTPTVIRQPSSASPTALRVGLKARRGKCLQAAADAAQLLKHRSYSSPHYCTLAALLVKTEHRQAYGQLCRKLLARSCDATNIYVAGAVAKSCFFLPASEVDLNVVSRLADTGLTVEGFAKYLPLTLSFQRWILALMNEAQLDNRPMNTEILEQRLTMAPEPCSKHPFASLRRTFFRSPRNHIADVSGHHRPILR